MALRTTEWLKALFHVVAVLCIAGIAASILLWQYPGAYLGLGLFGATQRLSDAAKSLQITPLSPADLNAVLLAVATIVLAVVAFLVSFAAFFGFGELRRLVEKLAAEDRARMNADIKDELGKKMREMDDFMKAARLELSARGDFSARSRGVVESEGLASGQSADDIAAASSGMERRNGD